MAPLDVPAALLTGLIATLVMTALTTMATRARMTAMPPMPVATSMMSGDRRQPPRWTPLPTTGHRYRRLPHHRAALLTAFDNDDWWAGTLIGVVHGPAVGLLLMPIMPDMRPRMTGEPATTHGPLSRRSVPQTHGQLEITAPGVLSKNWGGMTPPGLVIGHPVYGLLLALIYAWIA